MTEAEAKTQDCIGPPNCGREEDPPPAGVYVRPGWKPRRLCIGSACGMGWRSVYASYPADLKVLPAFEPRGYCGLAGKP
jgi:hypothetical protein